MKVPILMPQLGESIVEATVVTLSVGVGDEVSGDQEIIEVETNKAILHVTAPAPGKLVELTAEAQATYAVGTVLGYLEVAPEDAERLGLSPAADSNGSAAPKVESQRHTSTSLEMPETEPGTEQPSPGSGDSRVTVRHGGNGGSTPATRPGLPVPATTKDNGGTGYLSPRVRARLSELNLNSADLAAIAGSGAGGRVSAVDVESFIADLETRGPRPVSALRLAVADAMRRSWTRPLATVGRPIALDAVLAHRKSAAFPEDAPRPGVALYAGRALALALAAQDGGAAAGRLVGGRFVLPASLDIGFAVEVEDGVLTPVLRGADRTPLREMAAAYAEVVDLARARRLPPERMVGAVATVTNYGPFGLTWATPIPLPDQTLILGLAAARKAPSWDETRGEFVPVTEAEFTVSFDHRSLDGGGAGRLLERISALLAEPEKL